MTETAREIADGIDDEPRDEAERLWNEMALIADDERCLTLLRSALLAAERRGIERAAGVVHSYGCGAHDCPVGAAILALAPEGDGWLRPEQVEWIVNDIAELGVKIGNQFFFLYKGHSLVYGDDDASRAAGVVLNQDTDPPTRHMWRPVFKREFGECCHPINRENPTLIGTVSLDDSEDWRPLPSPPKATE